MLARDTRNHNVPYSGYGDGESEVYYANHLGSLCFQKESSFSCYTSALASGDGAQTIFNSSSVARRFQDLELAFCVEESTMTALDLLKAKTLTTGRYAVIFSIDE